MNDKSTTFGFTQQQCLILGIILLLLCMSATVVGLIVIPGFINLSNTQASLEIDPSMLRTLSEFESSSFCQSYGCVFVDKYASSGKTINMFVVENYPNIYDDILLEISTEKEIITQFGLILDGLPPQRPHLSVIDLQFIYSFIRSIMKSPTIDESIKDFIIRNIEKDIEQICLRYTLDREGEAYKDAYKQRTAVERINSQAKALGIERPYLRNGTAIANQNTLKHNESFD